MDILFSGIIGGILGAIITTFVSFKISNTERKNKYYSTISNLFINHNWNMISNKIDSGIEFDNIKKEVIIVCYQHLNLLFYAWSNKKIIKKDKSINGWKNWVKEIFNNSIDPKHDEFRNAYKKILTKKDIYPDSFLNWLKDEMNFSPKTLEDRCM